MRTTKKMFEQIQTTERFVKIMVVFLRKMLEQMDSSEIPVCSSIRVTLFTNATGEFKRNEPTNERANERICICWRNPSQSNHTLILANFSLSAESRFLIYLSLKIIHGLLHFGQNQSCLCYFFLNSHTVAGRTIESIKSRIHTQAESWHVYDYDPSLL